MICPGMQFCSGYTYILADARQYWQKVQSTVLLCVRTAVGKQRGPQAQIKGTKVPKGKGVGLII